MEKMDRSRLAIGLLLLILGVYLLAAQFIPSLGNWIKIELTWPLIVIGVGVFLLVLGLLTETAEMAVPACIVGGIGGILYYQNLTGDWASWAYIWSLIPGFVGIGILLSALLGRGSRGDVSGGLWLLLISAILFLIFGSFLGGRALLGAYWPVLLIILGVWLFLRAVFRPRTNR